MSCKVYGFYIVLSFKKQILHIVPLFVSGIYMKTFRGQKKDSGTQLSQEIAGFNPLKIFLKIFPKFPQTIDVKHRSHCLASESVWRHVPANVRHFPRFSAVGKIPWIIHWSLLRVFKAAVAIWFLHFWLREQSLGLHMSQGNGLYSVINTTWWPKL